MEMPQLSPSEGAWGPSLPWKVPPPDSTLFGTKNTGGLGARGRREEAAESIGNALVPRGPAILTPGASGLQGCWDQGWGPTMAGTGRGRRGSAGRGAASRAASHWTRPTGQSFLWERASGALPGGWGHPATRQSPALPGGFLFTSVKRRDTKRVCECGNLLEAPQGQQRWHRRPAPSPPPPAPEPRAPPRPAPERAHLPSPHLRQLPRHGGLRPSLPPPRPSRWQGRKMDSMWRVFLEPVMDGEHMPSAHCTDAVLRAW